MDSVRIFTKGDDYFLALKDAIAQAKKSIRFEVYIFEFDSVGISILEKLAEAAARGVDVSLMVDGVGSWESLDQIDSFCQVTEIDLKVFHPLPFSGFLYESEKTHNAILLWLKTWGRANQRNHRKCVIIDEKLIFTGGMNISEVHSEEARKEKTWRDNAVGFQSTQSELLIQAFELAWREAVFPFRKNRRKRLREIFQRKTTRFDEKSPFSLNDSRSKRKRFEKELCQRIEAAKKRVWIVTPYLNPTRSILKSLSRAAKNQVDVCLLLPDQLDLIFPRAMNLNFYGSLLTSGIRIFEYQKSILHAKMSLIDDRATLGSSNLNIRSFVHDLELEVAFENPSVMKTLEEIWEEDLRNSRLISLEEWQGTFALKRFLWRLLMIFRSWM